MNQKSATMMENVEYRSMQSQIPVYSPPNTPEDPLLMREVEDTKNDNCHLAISIFTCLGGFFIFPIWALGGMWIVLRSKYLPAKVFGVISVGLFIILSAIILITILFILASGYALSSLFSHASYNYNYNS